jgi:MFS family permease
MSSANTADSPEARVAAGERDALRRVAIATFVGTAMEWYDYYLFGLAASLVFNRLYFSDELSPFAAALAAFATFGVGFVARPFGAVLFGWVGDRIGLNRYQERRGSPEAVVARLEWGLLDETAP